MSVLKAVRDKIIVQKEEVKKQTESGIIIPESAQEKPQRGVVASVGNKVKSVEVGDNIMFSKWGGTEITVAGKDYVILKQDDVLAILHN